MNKNFLLCGLLFFGSGCHSSPQDTEPSPPSVESAQSSGSDTCRIDVEMTKAKARQRDLQSARNLRGYYSDCLTANMKDEGFEWALLAAKLGDKSDEGEFMNMVASEHFRRREPAFINCQDFDSIGQLKLANEGSLTAIHGSIEYAISCENDGLSEKIMDLAKRAADLGSADDIAFYADLAKVRS